MLHRTVDRIMIFIDWISAPDHASFNRSLFSALNLNDAHCYVFSKELAIDEVDCSLCGSRNSRIGRALSVLKLCWIHRNDRVIFLSYDQLLLPIIFLVKTGFMVFEHNTTPEGNGWSKHAIWQRLFFRQILRMAQFPGQTDILRDLKQKVIYVGSPISPGSLCEKETDTPGRGLFIAPSYRASLSEIDKIIPFVRGATIVVKQAVFGSSAAIDKLDVRIEPVEHINLDSDLHKIRGVVITVNSRVRGTGWFNDAITRSLPIITTNIDATMLFGETFPGYPFIDLSTAITESEFDKQMAIASRFDPTEYIKNHNSLLRERFYSCCKELGWPEPNCGRRV